MVFDILQGHDAFLWFATKDGLNRYDGYNFKIFAHDPFDRFSIFNNEIRQLFEDKMGRIWINYPQGLDIFVPASGHFFHLSSEHLPIYAGSANAGSPLTFTSTPDGAVWMTDRAKLWRIEAPEDLLNKKAASVPPGCNGLMTVLDCLTNPWEPFKRGIMIGFASSMD